MSRSRGMIAVATRWAAGAVRGAAAAAMCVLLVSEPLAGAAALSPQGSRRGPTSAGNAGSSDARVVHAVNRFTFGPKPGEVAAVRAMGLNQWFEMQLNPGRIDDSTLDARLAAYPAMRMSQAELLARYPSEQMVRELIKRNAPLPADPVEHAVYADAMAEIRSRQEQQQEKAIALATAPAPEQPMQGGMQTSSGVPAADTGAPPASQDSGRTGLSMDRPRPAAKSEETLFKDLEAVKIINLPPEQRFQRVLAMNGREFVSFRESLNGAQMAQFNEGLTPEQREEFAAMQNGTRMISAEVLQSRLLRDVYSERELEAVMTDFWLNHFNVFIGKNQNEPYLLPAYERDTIRPNALGKFEDLLIATAESPAMLVYLDNVQSIGPDSKAAHQAEGFAARLDNPQARAALKDRGLNENYGRELMELQTLGVKGGYTQKDVTEVAKVFTGWSILPPARGGEFQFDERRHEPGSKTVLGTTIHENGMNEGLEVLHMLATSPSTAHFVCGKLAVRFVSDTPPETLIDRMAKSWMDSGGDIKTVLRTMFNSPEFWATDAQRAKVKTPEEFVLSAVRASGAEVINPTALVGALNRLGMPLYGMQTPNGYSWLSEEWVSTGALVNRMNFALVLAGDKLPGIKTDWVKLLASTPNPRSAAYMDSKVQDPEVALKEAKLERVLLDEPASERTRAAVISQSADSTAAIQAQRDFQASGGGRGAIAMAIGGEYNPPMPPVGAAGKRTVASNGIPEDRQAAIMAGLLLGSPEFQRR